MADNYYNLDRKEMLDFIPGKPEKILEAGCGSGNFGAALKEKFNAEITGIELFESAAKEAITKLDKVICGNLEEKIDNAENNYYDLIIFNDVLEHLYDPWAILKKSAEKLAKGGKVVASIPNIRHLYTMFDIVIKKDFKYTDAGILDKTHLRFFTKKSIIRMFDECGYKIIKIQGTNGMKSFKFKILNILSFGFLKETSYLQFAVVAALKEEK